jgi:type VI secretion system secreted protein VgrG
MVSAGDNMSNSAGKDMSQTAGNNMSQTATGHMTENAKNKTEIIQEKITKASQESTKYAEKVTVFSTKENMHLESTSKTVQINSAEKSNLF